MRAARRTAALATLALSACVPGSNAGPAAASPPDIHVAIGWPQYGSGNDGSRFSRSDRITPATIDDLTEVWRYRTGDATDGSKSFGKPSHFKATPILLAGRLVFPTGYNRVVALDPRSGERLWAFDPEVDFSIPYSEMFTARGVAGWIDPDAEPGAGCRQRVFAGTLDARLIALDALSGRPCPDFGRNGQIDLTVGIARLRRGEYSVTSPPLVVNGVVIVGSSIGDNGGVELEEGAVRGFDARSGTLLWRFDPIPREADAPGRETWAGDSARRTGAANVWTAMAADAERDLVFLPTSSPSPDFYGGERLGDNAWANSIVALRATTGELVWAYQIVRHDLWDYDLASQPLLTDFGPDGKRRPALVLATKTGFVFVLDRETGAPLTPVHELAVPPSRVPGERAAASQRVPSIALHPTRADAFRRWSVDAAHAERCDAMLDNVAYAGIFTPPALTPTLLYPGNAGGVNWGSMAADPGRRLAFVAVNRLPTVVTLVPRARFAQAREEGKLNGVDAQFTAQAGTPYGMGRFDLYDRETGLMCHEGPWSTLVAIDLARGERVWEVPAGRAPYDALPPAAAKWGYFVRGGPMVTAGGVVFLATPFDFTLRAHDAGTGAELWHATLPAEPHATPMAYEADGRPYVVIAAGGALPGGDGRGDFLLAFSLKQTGP